MITTQMINQTTCQTDDLTGVTLTCKNDNLDLKTVLKSFTNLNLKLETQLQITPCFSCSVMMSYHNLLSFLKTINQNQVGQFLLVSGDKPAQDTSEKIHKNIEFNQPFDTIAVLGYLDNRNKGNINWNTNFDNLNIAVAHNPFEKTNMDKELEIKRLKQKLSYDCVKTVYLQLGNDITAIQNSLNQIRTIKPNLKIIGSILVPTPKMLQIIKNNPHYGYGYSSKYLNDIAFAQLQTSKLAQVYQKLEIEVLWSGLTKI